MDDIVLDPFLVEHCARDLPALHRSYRGGIGTPSLGSEKTFPSAAYRCWKAEPSAGICAQKQAPSPERDQSPFERDQFQQYRGGRRLIFPDARNGLTTVRQ